MRRDKPSTRLDEEQRAAADTGIKGMIPISEDQRVTLNTTWYVRNFRGMFCNLKRPLKAGVYPRDEYVETMRASPRAYEQSMHLLTDPLISLTPGGDTATLDTYAVVHQIGAVRADGERGGNATLGMRYVDDVVRDGDSWRILRRTATMLWMA